MGLFSKQDLMSHSYTYKMQFNVEVRKYGSTECLYDVRDIQSSKVHMGNEEIQGTKNNLAMNLDR
jgi:hypothetical protein